MRIEGFLILLFGGCRWYSLDEVPLDGGTPAQRAAAQSALVAFDEAVGRGRVELRTVRFAPVDEGALGAYQSGKITVHPGLDPDGVVEVVWHELCHAIDASEAMSEREPLLLLQLATGVFAERTTLHSREPEAEAFALLCDNGPVVSQIYSSPCQDGLETLWAGYAFLHDVGLWQPTARLDDAPQANQVREWSLTGVPDYFNLAAFEPTVLALVAYFADGQEVTLLDVYSGDPAPDDWTDPVLGADLLEEDLPAIRGLAIAEVVGWDDGPGSVALELHLTGNPGMPRRLLLWTGDHYELPADRCLMDGVTDHVALDQHVWFARRDGASVIWWQIDE